MKRLFLFVAFVFVSLFVLARQIPVNADYVNPVPEEYRQAVREARTGVVNAEGYRTGGFTTQLHALNDAIFRFTCDPRDTECSLSGALPTLARYGGLMFTNPPASSIAFVRDVGQTLGFIPKAAYAQGIGFSGLLPLLDIWKAFRNIAYLLLSVILVVIGFMVMFRKKIDPKTVVTVQNALPRVVVALLLVTFSYAIVGFMIDLMYLVFIFVINLLINSSKVLGPDSRDQLLTGGFWQLFSILWWSGQQTVDDLVQLIFNNNITDLSSFINNAASGFIPFLLENALASLIVSLAMLFAFVRIFFMLINAYIQILISLLIAPLQLMVEAIPGTSSFASWFKNLVANLSIFPITATLMLIGVILAQTDTRQNVWTPPLLTTGGGRGGVPGLIALGILMGIPTAANAVKEALKAKPPVAAGPGTILAPITGGFQTGMGVASQFFYGTQFLKMLPFPGKKKPTVPP